MSAYSTLTHHTAPIHSSEWVQHVVLLVAILNSVVMRLLSTHWAVCIDCPLYVPMVSDEVSSDGYA